MLFIEYPKWGIALLVDFAKVKQYPSTFQIMEPNVFLLQPMRISNTPPIVLTHGV